MLTVYGAKYRILLDHQILSDHGVFYPKALAQNFKFEIKLAKAENVVLGSDSDKLSYKLKNIELEYEIIKSPELATAAASEYTNGKEFAYDHIEKLETIPLKKD